MNSRDTSGLVFISVVLVLLLLLVFGILQWLHIPSGSFLDWVIGTASFWWLLVIVTVPWNIYFEAKAVLADAAESRRQDITVDMGQVRYAQVVAQRSLGVAIALHGLSTLALYGLAALGISPIGYISSAAALLLTGLRPAVSFYQYLAARLGEIRQAVKYPREDIVELRQRVMDGMSQVQELRYQLNLDEPHLDSWATAQETHWRTLRQDLDQLAADQRNLATDNQAAHSQLARDARNAIAQVSEDGRVLENVRELIRFFKSA